jgi:hypothetical protein
MTTPTVTATNVALEKRTTRKILWRVIPFIFTLYVISYVDRANIGYAALQMNEELALSSQSFACRTSLYRTDCSTDGGGERVGTEPPTNVARTRVGIIENPFDGALDQGCSSDETLVGIAAATPVEQHRGRQDQ